MLLKDRPLHRRDNTVLSTEVHKYIDNLVSFFGHEILSKAQFNLNKDLAHHGRCYSMWMQQLQKWLFALRLYDQISVRGTQTPEVWPEPVQKVVGDAFMLLSLANRMPTTVKEKYQKDLLTIQHDAFMFEIRTAWHYHLEGFDVEWYPLGHTKSSEFRVRGGGLDFDVECRRFSLDLSNRIKMATMADICDMLYDVLQRRNRWGEVKVHFSDDFRLDQDCLRQWKQAMGRGLDNSSTQLELQGGLDLTFQLQSSPSRNYSRSDLLQFMTGPETIWLLSKESGTICSDPVVFRCYGPRKTEQELRDYIYKTLRTKIETQLSQSRAGVIFVKFSGIKEPGIFNESAGMQDAIRKLFSRNHLAAIVLLCDSIARRENGIIVHETPSIVFRNGRTSFQDVAAASHLTRR